MKNILMSYMSKLMCLLLLMITSTVYAEDRASIMVFDASGSMWTQLSDGRTRIEVARGVIGDYLKTREKSVPLGLIAYGHNRKGDCSDIEILAKVAVQNSETLAKKINQIQPKGKTPLTDALALAVKQIPKTSEEADIILITDGLETCDKDPCALAKEIAAEGITIRTHVVGFGLTEKEAGSLACIAKETGGLLLRPQSGKELSDALNQIEKKVESKTTGSSIRVTVDYGKNTWRPKRIQYSAKNLATNEVIDLGESVGTKEVVQGISTTLLSGKWLLMAEASNGKGELEISVEDHATYRIPYTASEAKFSLKNHGAYQLGQSNNFLLNIEKPLQENSTYRVALTPVDATDWKTVISRTYLFGSGRAKNGSKTGFRSFNFKSPATAGKYHVIVTPEYLPEKIATFDVEFVDNAPPKITVPEAVKPNEVFEYTLYGNRYVNNTIFINQDDKKISEIWIANTIKEKGTFLTAPSEEGTYQIVYRYKDFKQETKIDILAELVVSKNAVEHSATPESQLQTKEVKNDVSTSNGFLAGNWVLKTDASDVQLLNVNITPSKGEKIMTGAFVINEKRLGQNLNGELAAGLKEDELYIAFKTTNGLYQSKLNQIKEKPAYEQFWAGELISAQGEKQAIQFVKIKPNSSKVEKSTNTAMSSLYDVEKNKAELIFVCKEKTCTYDDKETGLKGIPLIKDWAIEQPYFYETAAGVKSKYPTLLFVNTLNGLWISLNQRQSDDSSFTLCFEFGEKGRLSSEEKICLVTEKVDEKSVTEASIFRETIAFWRDKSYEKSEQSTEPKKQVSVGKAMSSTEIDAFLSKLKQGK